MEFLSQLWLPILLSGVAVFLVSSVIHMALPIHKSDYRGLPREAEVAAAMRELGVTPGHYMIPHASSMKECGSPEMQAKYQQGPVGFLSILPNGMPAMGAALVQWFVFTLVVSTFAAYLAWTALGPAADYLAAFRFTGTVAVLGYATSNVSNSIWKGASWWTTTKFVFDGVVYGLVTAGVFGWLWPSA